MSNRIVIAKQQTITTNNNKAISIGYFRVAFRICVKTSLNAKPFIWNEFHHCVYCHAKHTHLHMKGLVRGLVLKLRQEVTQKWSTVHFNRAGLEIATHWSPMRPKISTFSSVNLLTSKENDTTCGWKASFIRIDKWSQTQIFDHQLISPCLIQQLLYFKTH